MFDDTWTCHICGKERPDALISVLQRDISQEKGLPPGTMCLNVRHCNDNPECIDKAKTFSFLGKKDEPM